MSICLPDVMSLAFSQRIEGCCFQYPNATDIVFDRVYRGQTYWNSGLVLPWYSAGTDTWFYTQFHLYCEHDASGNQTFKLRWFDDVDVRKCIPVPENPPFELKPWTFLAQTCEPLVLTYEVLEFGNPSCYENGIKEPDDPEAICDFDAIITEAP